MKTLSVLFLSVLLSIFSYGQQNKTTYGKATYKYKYNFPNAEKDTLTGQLFFNSSGESYYVTALHVNLSRTTNYSIDINKPSSNQTVDSTIVYRNLVQNEHIFNVHTQLKRFLVKDTIKAINWVYGKDERKIGSFMCQSATGVVSGRLYKVWYTPEIPVSTGPWKFYGLPGLVVEATDDMNLVVFLLDSVEISSKHQRDFEEDKLVQSSISREKLDEMKKKDLEKMQAHAESMGVKLTFKVTNKGLELEY